MNKQNSNAQAIGLHIINEARQAIEERKERSAWGRGLKVYAIELLDGLEEGISGGYIDADDLQARKIVEKALLNGADDWASYSWGGSALIYDGDIAERLCSPSELKKTRNGERRPNSREELARRPGARPLSGGTARQDRDRGRGEASRGRARRAAAGSGGERKRGRVRPALFRAERTT